MRTSVALFVALAWISSPARAALEPSTRALGAHAPRAGSPSSIAVAALRAPLANVVAAIPTACAVAITAFPSSCASAIATLPSSLASLALVPRATAAAPAAPSAALEIQVPKNDGWVTDLAGMLDSNQERELEALMESYRQGTTNEIALLTVPDLGGQPIERFALEVGRAWKIGGKDRNNGALLVVSKNDRAMRIEVGRGLEGSLTDSVAGRIIRDVIVPEFKRGRFAEGLKQGVQAIHAAIGGDYSKLPKEKHVAQGGEIGVLVLLLIIGVIVLIAIINRRGRGPRGPRGRRVVGGLPTVFFPGIGGSWGGGGGGGSSGGGGFGGFGGGGGFSGGGASGRW